VNSRRTLFAAIYMAVIGPEVFIVQPGFVQGMVKYLGFSETTAGDIASAEMWGIAVTTVIMTFFATRFRWRHVFAGSLLIMIAGNLASLFADAPLWFGIWRFVAGFGAGGLVSLGFAVVGLTRNPDRNFGWLIMWVLAYGAVVLLAMPTAYDLVGLSGVIIFFALFPASGLAFVRWLPDSGPGHAHAAADAVDLPAPQRAMAMGGMFIYFLGQGVVWAYLFLIGLAGGASEQEVAYGLTASQFAGVAGAFSAALLGNRIGRTLPLGASILLTLLPLLALFGPTGALVYGIMVCIYNYAWNVAQPYMLAAMAAFDRSGRTVVNATACQMLGLANGPWIAARVITDEGFANVIWLGIALFSLSLGLMLVPVMKHGKLKVKQAVKSTR
jgi:predicted MFS family arabinose efflux permease